MKRLGQLVIVIALMIFLIALLMPDGGLYLAQFLSNVLATIVGAIIVFMLYITFKES